MGRRCKISEKRFKEAYKRQRTVFRISTFLGISAPTVYNYCKRFGLSVPIRPCEEALRTSLKVYHAYKNTVTLLDLAVKFKLSRTMARHALINAVTHLWSKDRKEKPKWPIPRRLSHIKIIHALETDPALFDNPEKISLRTGSSQLMVEKYLDYAYKKKTT